MIRCAANKQFFDNLPANQENKNEETNVAGIADALRVNDDDGEDKSDKIIGVWLADFKRVKNARQRKVNDFGLLSGSGTAKAKADNEPVEYLGDMVLRVGGKVVIAIAFGSPAALQEHAAEIEVTRNSFKKPD